MATTSNRLQQITIFGLNFSLITYKVYSDYSLTGALAVWLVHSSVDRVKRVRALARGMLCFCVRHFTLTVHLSTKVYK